MLTARSLKVTVILNPAEVAAVRVPTTARVELVITAGGRRVTADIAAKSLRKAQATITECAIDGVATVLQGKLIGDAITKPGW